VYFFCPCLFLSTVQTKTYQKEDAPGEGGFFSSTWISQKSSQKWVDFLRDKSMKGSLIFSQGKATVSRVSQESTAWSELTFSYVKSEVCSQVRSDLKSEVCMGWLRFVGSLKVRSLSQNIVFFIGLFCKRDQNLKEPTNRSPPIVKSEVTSLTLEKSGVSCQVWSELIFSKVNREEERCTLTFWEFYRVSWHSQKSKEMSKEMSLDVHSSFIWVHYISFDISFDFWECQLTL